MRSERPVYIHTNKGVEKLDFLGVLSALHMDDILKELIRNRESGSHGFGAGNSVEGRVEDKIRLAMAEFSDKMVSDFSCDGIPMGDNGERSGRLRIQAHLSSSGLGVTCRSANSFASTAESKASSGASSFTAWVPQIRLSRSGSVSCQWVGAPHPVNNSA